jgi:acetate kinase
MTTLLTINTGSTSVKLALFDCASAPATKLWSERHDDRDLQPARILSAAAARLNSAPDVVVHRVVHGGTEFSAPVRVGATVLASLEGLNALAPLHNPVAIRWLRAAGEIWGAKTAQLAVFDTAFFSRLPRVAAEYALAPQFGVQKGVRRYGFHGLAHESLWRQWCALHPELPGGGRLISLQLGGGCSVAAIAQGRPMDISMGFSPLEGLMMSTRSGDLDPAAVAYLANTLQLGPDAVVELLERKSGLAGVSGSDADASQLLASSDPQARFAGELYCYRIRKYIGAYLAVLGGCDGIVFGGGVGEHSASVRAHVIEGLAALGATLDAQLNEAAGGSGGRISAHQSGINIHVLSSDEEAILAAAGAAFLRSAPA